MEADNTSVALDGDSILHPITNGSMYAIRTRMRKLHSHYITIFLNLS